MRLFPFFIFLISISLPSPTALAIPQPPDRSYLDTQWGKEINSHLAKLKSTGHNPAILEQVDKIILREFEKNILHPPLLNKNRTAGMRKGKFFLLISAMVDVAQNTADADYLDHILLRLSTNIFGVRERKDKVILSTRKLRWRESLFKGMDKELREAVFETKNPDTAYMFFTKFYFRLIKIDGFLNYIYKYGGQKPFEYFIDRFDRKQLESSSKELQTFLAGLDFINAESSLYRLLLYFYKKRGVNIWEHPDIILSKNINIPIFVRILKNHKSLPQKAHDHIAILTKLLDHLDDKDYLIQKVKFKAHTYHNSMTYFNFIYNNVLLPWEVKRYHFKDSEGKSIPFDKLIDKKGKIIIDSDSNVTDRQKVDGSLRQQFCNKLLKFDLLQVFGSQTKMDADFSFKKLAQQQQSYILKNVFATIFLPNTSYNNAGDEFSLYKYNKNKMGLFLKLKKNLSQTYNPRLISTLLKSVLRLNKSYRSGFLQMPFYIVANDLYKKYFGQLPDEEKKALIIERLKLGLSSKRIEGKNNLEIYFSDLTSTTNDLMETYRITPPPINNLSDVITYRATSGNSDDIIKRIEELEGDEKMFFLVSNLKNLLYILNKKETLAPKDAENIYMAINNILDIYHHYLPFFSNIDPASILENKDALLLMALLNKDEVKYPFTILIKFPFMMLHKKLLDKDKFPQDENIKSLRQKIVSKLIMHNFTACELIFHALENNRTEELNVKSRDIKYKLLDFDLLIPVNETRRVDAKNLIEDTLASFALNLSLLRGVDEDFIYRYLFGNIDMSNYQPAINIETINCFDYVIRRALKADLYQSPEGALPRINRFVLDQAEAFPDIYNILNSVFGIQKLWEMIMANIVSEESKPDKMFFEKYNSFYMQGNFVKGEETNKTQFRDNIIDVFVEKFYADNAREIDLEKKLSRFSRLCSGKDEGNWGLMGAFSKHRGKEIEYISAYSDAVVDLMQKTFIGKELGPNEWYLGQMFYDNQQKDDIPIADQDLFSDKFFRMYEWIWESAMESAEHPEIRSIFVDDDTWDNYTGQP